MAEIAVAQGSLRCNHMQTHRLGPFRTNRTELFFKGVFIKWTNPLDFEIIPTNNILPAHHLLITFPPTSWLLLPWQASPHGKVRGDMISRPGSLRTSEIPIPLLVSLAVMHHCHHPPALPFRDWQHFTKPVLILTEEFSSTFVPRCFPVLYPISRSGT